MYKFFQLFETVSLNIPSTRKHKTNIKYEITSRNECIYAECRQKCVSEGQTMQINKVIECCNINSGAYVL